jgi:hypothetical protein
MFSMFERMNESVMQFPSGIAPQSHAYFHVTVHLRMHLYINVATRPRAQVRVCGLWLVARVNVQGLWSVVGSPRPLVHTHKFRSVVCGRQYVRLLRCCHCHWILHGCDDCIQDEGTHFFHMLASNACMYHPDPNRQHALRSEHAGTRRNNGQNTSCPELALARHRRGPHHGPRTSTKQPTSLLTRPPRPSLLPPILPPILLANSSTRRLR